MGALILPHRLQQQPQQVAVVDNGNPLARGLRAVLLPNMPELVTGAATAGTAPYGVTQAGRAWAFAGVATQFIEVPNIAYQAPPFSVLVVVRKSATAADALVSFGGAASGNGWKVGSGTAATTFRLTYGGVADYSLTNFWDTTGGVTVAVVTVQGTVARVFKNGVFFGQITVGTPKTPASKPLTIGALHNGTGYAETSTSSISAAGVLSRALSDAEAISLSGNPWQLFKAPTRRLWTAATAPANGALANASAAGFAATAGALSTAITLSGATAGQAATSAALTSSIVLAGSAAGSAQAAGSLTTGISLSGAALGSASGTAAMGSPGVTLGGTATGAAVTSGALMTAIALSGAAVGGAATSAALASSIALSGSTAGQAQTQGSLTTAIALAGAAIAQAQASAALGGVGAALSGGASASASAAAQLTTGISMTGAVQARASGQAALSTQITLVAIAQAQASASASLQLVPFAAPLLPNPHRTYVGRPRARKYTGQARIRSI